MWWLKSTGWRGGAVWIELREDELKQTKGKAALYKNKLKTESFKNSGVIIYATARICPTGETGRVLEL